ncbi:Fibroblast growth factor receptor 3 [Aphelenchoides avenae]|nr:Fibroblast growth factor receptor 3 [Aphelenchus avenae]
MAPPVPLKDLEISPHHLGSGAFGTVRKAKLSTSTGIMGVAVKLLHECNADKYRFDMLLEIDLMHELGSNPHILHLHGHSFVRDSPVLVLEYCENGDLLNFLRRHTTHSNMVQYKFANRHCLRTILANSFVEQFDWVSNFSWPDSWQKEHLPTFHIKRLNHAFDTHRPRLLPLRCLGDVSVQLLEVNVQSWGWSFNKDLRNLFEPLKDTEVEKLSVNCDWVAADTEEVSFVDACFAPHSTGPAPHFVVRNARIRSDFLVRIVDKARQCLCECDVYLEMTTYTDNFVYLDSAPPECNQEDLGQLRIFNFDWPKNSLRIELERYKLVGRYSWKRNGD